MTKAWVAVDDVHSAPVEIFKSQSEAIRDAHSECDSKQRTFNEVSLSENTYRVKTW